jgi:DNA adenine methylase
MIDLLKKYKTQVDVFLIDYKYHFANQNNKVGDNNNDVQEYLFLAY